jgi:hypothetical protein
MDEKSAKALTSHDQPPKSHGGHDHD